MEINRNLYASGAQTAQKIEGQAKAAASEAAFPYRTLPLPGTWLWRIRPE